MELELEHFICASQGFGSAELYLENPAADSNSPRLQARGRSGNHSVNEADLKQQRAEVARAFQGAIKTKMQLGLFIPGDKKNNIAWTSKQKEFQKIYYKLEGQLKEQLKGNAGLTGDEILEIATRLEKEMHDATLRPIARTVTKVLRSRRGSTAITRANTGTDWKLKAGKESLTQRSESNLKALYQRIRDTAPVLATVAAMDFPMSIKEQELYTNILGADYYIAHSTKQDLTKKIDPQGNIAKSETMTLRSREALEKRGLLPPEAKENTSAQDIIKYKLDDFVFFSVEAGDHLQKSSSRFGGRIYRLPIGEATKQGGLMLTHDLIHPPKKITSKRELFNLPNIADAEFEYIQTYEPDGTPDLGNTSSVFPANSIHKALACLVIDRVRQFNEEQQEEIYKLSKTGDGINSIINGLLRPQVLIPQVFYSQNFQEYDLSNVHKPAELADEFEKLSTRDPAYLNKLQGLIAEVKNLMPPSTDNNPLDLSGEKRVMIALNKHISAIGERDMAKLLINYTSRVLYKFGNDGAKTEMEEILAASSLNSELKTQIKGVFPDL